MTIKLDAPPWYANRQRLCLDDPRYTEPETMTPQERRQLAAECGGCPVYFECLSDLLAHTTSAKFYGVQAGYVGKYVR